MEITAGRRSPSTNKDLRRPESELQSIFRAAPAGIGLVRDRVFVWVNERLCDMLGFSENELVGQSARMVYPSDEEFERVGREKYAEIEKSGVGSVETRLKCADGSVIDVLLSSAALDPSDLSLGATFTALDISERKRAEKALEESQQRYRELVENARIGILIDDLEGGFPYFNREFARIFGYSIDEIREKSIASLVHPEDLDRVMATHQARLTGERAPSRYNFRGLRSDGSVVFLEVSAVPMVEGEHVTGTRSYIWDVTDDHQKQAERERLLHDMQERVKELSCLYGVADVIRSSNRLEDIFSKVVDLIPDGFQYSDITCSKIEYYDDEFHSQGCGECQCILSSEITVAGESVGRVVVGHKEERPDSDEGQFLVEERALVDNIAGALSQAIEKKNAVDESRRLEEQLRQAQKMEAVGQLAGGIAHDFNNLLQSIRMHVDLSLVREGLDDEVSGHIAGICEDAERAAALTRQLLAFSRRQDLQPRSTDLNELIPGVLHLLGRVLGEDIELSFEPAEELPRVSVDPGQIEQVVMNLAVNARDAMPTGGRITISTDVVDLDNSFCTAHALPTSGTHVRLQLRDTGCGMEPEVLQQIFEPFFTTKEIGKGTGLGLATVYGTVRQHSGTVIVESELGKGSTFSVLLPPRTEATEDQPEVEVQPRLFGYETILVAEDERSVRELVVKALEESGYTVIAAADGEEAVRKFREHDGLISVALLDAVMPRLGGREAMERIKALDPSVRVLFSTGFASDGLHRRFALDDSLEVMHKPYSVAELLRKIRDVLDRK